uniref:Xaa-Pro dipeptidyl-peptidase-like domain-containing protein n=1 Tax=Aureoumbra lagunensis TaxID=44058 RepID=A0A7S3K435_9STRA|mmetsp:Transcript_23193/g.30013  ORF Transcript_23193/g.30013 Transcript_23193/m.30013 type:complete len:605 (+) Transcript_23193:23-1837(+)
MLCACYGESSGDAEQYARLVHSGWLRLRIEQSNPFGLERRRFVTVRRSELGAWISCYVDEGCRRLLATLPLGSLEFIGEPRLILEMCRKGAHPREIVWRLRFDNLQCKHEWWRIFQQATEFEQNIQDSEEEEEDILEEIDDRRRDSENSASNVERGIVWERHGMCVVEDNSGRLNVEPRMIHTAKLAYSRIIRAFIRPPRAEYDMSALGPRAFRFRGSHYIRRDKCVRNYRGRLVRYSIWRPEHFPILEDVKIGKSSKRKKDQRQRTQKKTQERVQATIIYLHGNASSRVEALAQLALCLNLGNGVQVIALDCCGSGKSQGEYVSLGFKEQEDVLAVVDKEKQTKRGIGHLALWGRSMGAVTAMLVASTRLPETSALILDSAFSSLPELALDIARRGASHLPAFVFRSALRWIRDGIKRRADFDIVDVDAARHAPECVVPALFIAASDDNFVEPKHSATLLSLLPDCGNNNHSQQCIVPGSHNSTRPTHCFDQIEIFLREKLGLQSSNLPLASELDLSLSPLLPQARRSSRPNFAALAPWTIENLSSSTASQDGAIVDSPSAGRELASTPTPRWLNGGNEQHVDKVDEMQAATIAVAEQAGALL